MSQIAGRAMGETPGSAADPRPSQGGTAVAPSGLPLLAVLTLSGCLITQPVHFNEPPNSPPAIYDAPSTTYPLNQIVHVIHDPTMTAGDAGMTAMTSLTLAVTVYDADVAQQLSWIAYVDSDSGAPCSGCSGFILAEGTDRRNFEFTVPLTQITATVPSCHRIDLYVSSAFNPGGHTPRESTDVATATWWVSTQLDSSSSAALTDCPHQ